MANATRLKPNRKALTDHLIKSAPLRAGAYYLWDTVQLGLCLRVRPSGAKTFLVSYQYGGRSRWFSIDRFGAIGLSEARASARQIRAKAALGQDPQGNKMSQREGDTFEKVHDRYLEKARENKSWQQAYKLVRRYVLPTLGKRKIKDIGRQEMWRLFDGLSDRKILANLVLASASAVFSWAVKRHIIPDNPCSGIERNKTTAASRYLSNDEIRTVWSMFEDLGLLQGTALRLVLLTAQRPGEVCAMRWEHLDLVKGLWVMPGEKTIDWPGTKNKRDHEAFLTAPAVELLRDLDPQKRGYVFPSTRTGKCILIPSTRAIWSKAKITRFRPHDLRATAATGMDALHVSRQHISLVLNHTEGGVTAGYVRHDQRDHKRNALEMWSKELMLILERKGQTDHVATVVSLRA